MKFFVVALFALFAVAAATDSDAHAEVVRSDNNVNVDSFDYKYETSNGLSGSATGQLKNFGPEKDAVVQSGAFGWTDASGEKVELTWVADENGYQPTGSHIPTPPPVPSHVLRALEWIAAHPHKGDH